MVRILAGLLVSGVVSAWASTTAHAQPPDCQPWLYCTFIGQAINDPRCWCHWDDWRARGPVPYWWRYRYRYPDYRPKRDGPSWGRGSSRDHDRGRGGDRRR